MSKKYVKTFLVESPSNLAQAFDDIQDSVKSLHDREPLKNFRVSIRGKSIPPREFEGRKWNIEVNSEINTD